MEERALCDDIGGRVCNHSKLTDCFLIETSQMFLFLLSRLLSKVYQRLRSSKKMRHLVC